MRPPNHQLGIRINRQLDGGVHVSKWLDGGGQIGKQLAKGIRISKRVNGSILNISKWRDREAFWSMNSWL